MVNDGNSYSHLGNDGGRATSSAWLEKQQSGSRRSKLMVRPSITSILFAVERRSGSVTGAESWLSAKGLVLCARQMN